MVIYNGTKKKIILNKSKSSGKAYLLPFVSSQQVPQPRGIAQPICPLHAKWAVSGLSVNHEP